MNKCGFSLLELIIVIALLAIIVGLNVGSYTFVDRCIVRDQVFYLQMVCTYLHYQAMALGTLKEIIFDVPTSYTYEAITHVLPQGALFECPPDILGPPGHPIHAITKAVTFPNNRILFYPDGSISAGTVYITDKNKQYRYALTIAVSSFPYIRTYMHTTTWHLIS